MVCMLWRGSIHILFGQKTIKGFFHCLVLLCLLSHTCVVFFMFCFVYIWETVHQINKLLQLSLTPLRLCASLCSSQRHIVQSKLL